MLFFASCAALGASALAGGCVATSTIEFEAAENYPPSVVSEPNAEYPLNRIGQLNLDDPVETPELPLEVVIRDPNVDQTLDYRIFLNSPPAPEVPFNSGEVPPEGFVERPTVFFVPYDLLVAGRCHRIELVVVGEFDSFVEPRRPVEEGDFDDATWWVEVTDAANPVIVEQCR